MCHSRIGMPRVRATSTASIVLPVPGSPLTSSGRSSAIAALTASVRSSVETYDGEPVNLTTISIIAPLFRGKQDQDRMKNVLRFTLLGAALALAASVPAQQKSVEAKKDKAGEAKTLGDA